MGCPRVVTVSGHRVGSYSSQSPSGMPMGQSRPDLIGTVPLYRLPDGHEQSDMTGN